MSLSAITSPCTGICKLDAATGWCLGCARSGDEIAGWGSLAGEMRDSVWDQIPARLSQLGVTCRRLPWTTADIRRFVQGSLTAGAGTWAMGVPGAVAEFAPLESDDVTVETNGAHVTARTHNAALSVQIDDHLRALTFDPEDTPLSECRIVLAVKRERGRLPMSKTVTDLGKDRTPLMEATGQHLIDLGLARKEARFCVRLGPGPAMDALRRVAGQPFLDALPAFAPTLLAESPTRVVESALGRIEVSGPIPQPGGTSPAGSHTHLVPDHLASGQAMPTGMDLPRAYLPGAIFYPRIRH